jgi:hypothetical protein
MCSLALYFITRRIGQMAIVFYTLAPVGMGIKVGLGFVDSHDTGFCFLISFSDLRIAK